MNKAELDAVRKSLEAAILSAEKTLECINASQTLKNSAGGNLVIETTHDMTRVLSSIEQQKGFLANETAGTYRQDGRIGNRLYNIGLQPDEIKQFSLSEIIKYESVIAFAEHYFLEKHEKTLPDINTMSNDEAAQFQMNKVIYQKQAQAALKPLFLEFVQQMLQDKKGILELTDLAAKEIIYEASKKLTSYKAHLEESYNISGKGNIPPESNDAREKHKAIIEITKCLFPKNQDATLQKTLITFKDKLTEHAQTLSKPLSPYLLKIVRFFKADKQSEGATLIDDLRKLFGNTLPKEKTQQYRETTQQQRKDSRSSTSSPVGATPDGEFVQPVNRKN